MKGKTHFLTLKGEHHKENEDTLLLADLNDSAALYAVADGITRPYGGGPASRYVISELAKTVRDHPQALVDDLSWALQLINQRLIKATENDPTLGGTTITVAVTHKDKVTFAQVGDSVGLLIRKGKIVFQTESHNTNYGLVNYFAKPGMMPTINSMPVSPGDWIVLASDGVTNYYSPQAIAHRTTMPDLEGKEDPQGIVVENVIATVTGMVERGYKDDVSMIAALLG